MYRHLTLNRNGTQLLDVQHARLFIMEIVENGMGPSIEVSAGTNLILISKFS